MPGAGVVDPAEGVGEGREPVGSGDLRHRVLVVETPGTLLERADHRHDRRALLDGVDPARRERVAVAHLLDGEADRQGVVTRTHEVAVERVDRSCTVAVVEVAHGDAGGHDALGEDLATEDAPMGHLLAATLEDAGGRGADRLGGVTSLDVGDGDLRGADVAEGQHLDEVLERGQRARFGGGVGTHRSTLVAPGECSLRPPTRVTPPSPGPSAGRPARRPRAGARHRR